MKEQDDYQSDIRFGEWLRTQRVRAGLTLESASTATGLPVDRLKALEMGLSDRGITKAEANKISGLYKIPLHEFLEEASRT